MMGQWIKMGSTPKLNIDQRSNGSLEIWAQLGREVRNGCWVGILWLFGHSFFKLSVLSKSCKNGRNSWKKY